MDGTASRIVVARSNADQPRQVYLADSAGKQLNWLSENAIKGDHPYAPYLASHAKTRRSEEHTSELQSLMRISYAVFCLKTKRFQYRRTDSCTIYSKSKRNNYRHKDNHHITYSANT